MLMRLLPELEPGEIYPEVPSGSTARISVNAFKDMLRLVGANFDALSPKQDRDAITGELLYVDASRNVATASRVAELSQPVDPLAPNPRPAVTLTPKYVARTPEEVWTKIAAQATKALLDQYLRLAQDEAARNTPPAPTRPVVVPVVPPTVI